MHCIFSRSLKLTEFKLIVKILRSYSQGSSLGLLAIFQGNFSFLAIKISLQKALGIILGQNSPISN